MPGPRSLARAMSSNFAHNCDALIRVSGCRFGSNANFLTCRSMRFRVVSSSSSASWSRSSFICRSASPSIVWPARDPRVLSAAGACPAGADASPGTSEMSSPGTLETLCAARVSAAASAPVAVALRPGASRPSLTSCSRARATVRIATPVAFDTSEIDASGWRRYSARAASLCHRMTCRRLLPLLDSGMSHAPSVRWGDRPDSNRVGRSHSPAARRFATGHRHLF